MNEIDEQIKKLKEKIGKLQQKKIENAAKNSLKFLTSLQKLLEKDENFNKDFVNLLKKYEANEILEILNQK